MHRQTTSPTPSQTKMSYRGRGGYSSHGGDYSSQRGGSHHSGDYNGARGGSHSADGFRGNRRGGGGGPRPPYNPRFTNRPPRHDYRQQPASRQRQDTTQSEASVSRQVRVSSSKREQRGRRNIQIDYRRSGENPDAPRLAIGEVDSKVIAPLPESKPHCRLSTLPTNPDVFQIVVNFVNEYMNSYDSDRDKLLDAYQKKAIFSLSINVSPAAANRPFRFGEFIKDSRNLKKVLSSDGKYHKIELKKA